MNFAVEKSRKTDRRSTEVPLRRRTRSIKIPRFGKKNMCEELNRIKREAVRVFREVRRIRRSKDLSFHEDAELARDKHRSLHAVLKHLLVGHDGKPCPAGSKPIVGHSPGPRTPAGLNLSL